MEIGAGVWLEEPSDEGTFWVCAEIISNPSEDGTVETSKGRRRQSEVRQIK
jgi:hypothetical protein